MVAVRLDRRVAIASPAASGADVDSASRSRESNADGTFCLDSSSTSYGDVLIIIRMWHVDRPMCIRVQEVRSDSPRALAES